MTSLQAKRARTSLIDAEWDWIANRMVERDGHWAVASVINPSLARIAYAPAKRTTASEPRPELPAAPEPSRTWKSADLSPHVPGVSAVDRPSLFAVLLVAVFSLVAGALLHRATSSSGVVEQPQRDSSAERPPAPAKSAAVAASGAAPMAVSSAAGIEAAAAAIASASEPVRKPAPRSWPRPRPKHRPATRKSTAQSDNPY
jgi:hypothetical protein